MNEKIHTSWRVECENSQKMIFCWKMLPNGFWLIYCVCRFIIYLFHFFWLWWFKFMSQPNKRSVIAIWNPETFLNELRRIKRHPMAKKVVESENSSKWICGWRCCPMVFDVWIPFEDLSPIFSTFSDFDDSNSSTTSLDVHLLL